MTGVTRAAWAAQQLTPTNRDALGPGVEPQFPPVALQDDAAPFVPRANVLPDRWIVVGMRQGTKVLEQVGAAIPHDLAVGLDTTPSETQGLTNQEGSPIQLPPRMRWLTDFALAVQVGMAFDLAVAPDVEGFDELYVFGVRLTETPQHSAARRWRNSSRATATAAASPSCRRTRRRTTATPAAPACRRAATASSTPSISSGGRAPFRRWPRTGWRRPGPSAWRRRCSPRCRIPAPSRRCQRSRPGFEPELAAAMLSVLWQTNMGAFAEDFLQLTPAQATRCARSPSARCARRARSRRCASAGSRTACCR